MGISVTPKQRDDVDRELQRTDLTRRMRERLEMVKAAALGDDVERIARWSGRSVETVERWVARFAAGGVARAGRCGALGAACAGGCGLSSRHGNRAGDAAPAVRLGLRRVDLAAAVGLLGAADGRIYLARLAAGALGRAWLGLRATQAHAQAPAGPGRGGRLPRRAGGGGGKRCERSRSAPSSTSRTRRIWRPIRIWRGRGIARANNQRSLASGSIGASRCLAASKRWDARAWNWCARRRTPPGSCAIWSCWTGITRRCSGRSIWCSIMARRLPAG